ncbi:MAG TPA: hypothetical protein VFI96_04685, partial [Longimicrobiaceae bacterium]|nr:hypothetical protein [Longimicrobiaceae bacterium]
MERRVGLVELRRNHPVFFWGCAVLVALLLIATVAMAIRIPVYRSEAAQIGQRMDAQERATRDRILQAKRRRASLAVALIRREVHLKALQEKG